MKYDHPQSGKTVVRESENVMPEPAAEREGVVKYHLEFTRCAIEPGIDTEQLDQWRHILFNLQLIGQDPGRYHGLGFGNASCRLIASKPAFLITGSQTGKHRFLSREHFSIVTQCDPVLNHIDAYGECQPSSESMTHGVLYAEDETIGAVVHVHSPLIWEAAQRLDLLSTPRDVPYGTPAMADAVVGVSRELSQRKRTPVFIMLGHKDGVVSYGVDLRSAVMALLEVYNRAIHTPA